MGNVRDIIKEVAGVPLTLAGSKLKDSEIDAIIDELEHQIITFYADIERRAKAEVRTELESEYKEKISSANFERAQALESLKQVQERNKRQHEALVNHEKRESEYKNVIQKLKDQVKTSSVSPELLTRMEDEIEYLRVLLLANAQHGDRAV